MQPGVVIRWDFLLIAAVFQCFFFVMFKDSLGLTHVSLQKMDSPLRYKFVFFCASLLLLVETAMPSTDRRLSS